jgi:hypothetical protein
MLGFSQLTTTNLKMSVVIDTLGLSGNTTLESICLSGSVNKYGLNAVYVSGEDADARLATLQSDKKLSYFKGYKHVPYDCNYALTSGGYSPDTVLYQVSIPATEGVYWLNYQAYGAKDYFDLYDGTTIIDGTVEAVSYGPYIGTTSDTEFNFPIWYYADGSISHVIFNRTYTPSTGTVWNFQGNCPFTAVENQDYTQSNGICLYFDDVTSSTWDITASSVTDSVYIRAYEASTRTLMADIHLVSPILGYSYNGTPPADNKVVLVCYSRNNASYTLNFNDN